MGKRGQRVIERQRVVRPLNCTAKPFSCNQEYKEKPFRYSKASRYTLIMALVQQNDCFPFSFTHICAYSPFPLFTSLNSSKNNQPPSLYFSSLSSLPKCYDEFSKHCSLHLLLFKDSPVTFPVIKSLYLKFPSVGVLRERLRKHSCCSKG